MKNPQQNGRRTPTESARAILVLTVILGLGVLVVTIFALQNENRAAAATISLTIAGASLLTGGLLGFLFGIPRTLQDGAVEIAKSDDPARPGQLSSVAQYRANTNLEQISDWLTKILVGVGLTQIAVIPDRLQALSNVAARGLGGSDASATFIAAALVYFAIDGFLFGYLWTRLFLPGAFRQADVLNLEERVSAQEEKLSVLELKAQSIESIGSNQ